MLMLLAFCPALADGQTIAPSSFWKNQVVIPNDPFCSRGISRDSVRWVKFTILREPYDPNVVYFQDSRRYLFHYSFGADLLAPFAGMTPQQFNAVTLFEQNQQAILGTVILPPQIDPPFNEYGIQFVRQDAFAPGQIRDLFALVKANVVSSPETQAFYFPTFEQQATAKAHQDWFESQGIPLSSTARWAQGNTCYSQGWAVGRLKFFPGEAIADAYQRGFLEPGDILLTDGIPAELPYVAGILSLAPSTPNSHVAILANTYGVPFVHLALESDALSARQMVGHTIIVGVYQDTYGACDLRLLDVEDRLDEATVANILEIKKAAPLAITPTAPYGAYSVSTDRLQPSDIQYVGGKASNFALLRAAIPDRSPRAVALTFDLWNAFLDQPMASVPQIDLGPGQHLLIWADGDTEQGPTHAAFKLDKSGEFVGLYDVDGHTPIDTIRFESQETDVSWGRTTDGSDMWQSFAEPTPGRPNADGGTPTRSGLVINEFMADNKKTLEDPNEPGEHPDWIELYNASDAIVTLNGLYLTDDANAPTRWRIPLATQARTLREEIGLRLAGQRSYPPDDMQTLTGNLASVRDLLADSPSVGFNDELRDAVLAELTGPANGFDPNAMLRFRSSTNVEDSEDFVGAGLYDSFSGCLGDDLDTSDGDGCRCDPNADSERGVFEAIRKVFASFYNDNAYLERLRHEVNEADVGIALLVHHSFPDEIELANGVATIEVTGERTNTTITLVSQHGAVSITNPQDASIAEEVTVLALPSGSVVPPKLQRASSLVPLGGTVMTWPDDYKELSGLLLAVSDAFKQITGKTAYLLDLEYKKVAPGGAALPEGGLIVKQVREVPKPRQGAGEDSVLINIPANYEIFTGEFELLGETDLFADHRLKSRWRFETDNMALDANSLSEGLYGNVDIEYLDEDQYHTLSGEMAGWPSAEHRYDDGTTTDTWQVSHLSNPRVYHLHTTGISQAISRGRNPLLLVDFGSYAFDLPYRCLALEVEYEHPVPAWHQQLWPADAPSGFYGTTQNTVYLWCPPEPSPDDVPQERYFASDGISIRTSFYFPPPPSGYPDWVTHTAPLTRWDRTVIEGLSDEPIILRGYYSQTYRPEHHNLIEGFLFEPRLEPGISASILTQLDQQDIRLIHLVMDNQGGPQSRIVTYGFDDLSIEE